MQFYTDPSRENDPHALPNAEVFQHDPNQCDTAIVCHFDGMAAGYYWWSCFPGCLPDSEPTGPFVTEAEAIADAQEI